MWCVVHTGEKRGLYLRTTCMVLRQKTTCHPSLVYHRGDFYVFGSGRPCFSALYNMLFLVSGGWYRVGSRCTIVSPSEMLVRSLEHCPNMAKGCKNLQGGLLSPSSRRKQGRVGGFGRNFSTQNRFETYVLHKIYI